MVEPTQSYLICGSNRTGSTVLCSILEQTGVAGRATHEFFWKEYEQSNQREWGIDSFEEYLHEVRARTTTPNGVLGIKVMWGYLPDVLGKLRTASGKDGASDLEVLRMHFPRPRFVWMRRANKLAQAVSWARAIQTEQWISSEKAQATPRLDLQQIDECLGWSINDDRGWHGWFQEHDLRPFELFYEELSADLPGSARRVLQYLELPTGEDIRLEPSSGIQKQGDAINDAWMRRYREHQQAAEHPPEHEQPRVS